MICANLLRWHRKLIHWSSLLSARLALSQPALQDPLGRVINVTMGLLSCLFSASFQRSCLAEKVVPLSVFYLLTHFSKSTLFPTTSLLPT